MYTPTTFPRICPGCEQPVIEGQCGGPDEGICVLAEFAMDVGTAREPETREFLAFCEVEPPDAATLAALRAFWGLPPLDPA